MQSFILGGLTGVSIILSGPAALGADQPGSEIVHPLGTIGTYQTLVVSIPHHLNRAEARRRLKIALTNLQKDYSFFFTIEEKIWTGNHLRFRARVLGQAAVGRLDITKDHVNLRVLLPSSLSILADIAQPLLVKQGTALLAKRHRRLLAGQRP